MKKFLIYVFIFSLPVLGVATVIEVMLRKIPNDYQLKRTFLDKHADSLEVLFLGNSHMYYGIDPEFIHLKSFNAAYVSQSYDYDLAILKKYENNFKQLRYIVIPVDYGAFYQRLESGFGAWRVKNYNIYYSLHTSGKLINNSELLSIGFRYNISRLKNYYYRHSTAITCNPWGWGTAYNSQHNQDLVLTGISAAKRHTASDYKYFNEICQTLKSIIELARKMNTKVLLISCPTYKTYTQHLDSTQLNRAINEATKMVSEYDNVSYLNLLNSEAFKAEDFYDADHLNEIGAKKFSLMVDSLINPIRSREKSTIIKPGR